MELGVALLDITTKQCLVKIWQTEKEGLVFAVVIFRVCRSVKVL
jgi:hypothetical protein